MKRVGPRDRVRYAFDKSMAAGTIALIGWLALASLAVIFTAALILTAIGIHQDESAPLDFSDAAWASLMRTLDPGTMGGDTGWAFRTVMFVVTLAGLFIVSSLIGVLSAGLSGRLEQLRKGRSFVLEENHTLILGWTPSIFLIIAELGLANANQSKSRIVVLADKDKIEMEDEIRDKAGDLGRTQVICRTGAPNKTFDLEIANPYDAKSIIVLSPEEGDADSQVIKTVLALTKSPDRDGKPFHIVTEIRDHKNLEIARIVGGDEVQLVLVDEVMARITAQACRQSGMSVIYTELLDYKGDEIYFGAAGPLAGQTFGAALAAFETCALIGLQFGDGRVQLNPPLSTPIAARDRLIVIAEDDDCIVPSASTPPVVNEADLVEASPAAPCPEHTLILGWNRRGARIITEVENYVAPGSRVTIVALPGAVSEGCRRELSGALQNQTLVWQEADTTNRLVLDALDVASFSHVIALSYSDLMGAQEADAKTLVTLLHLRHIARSGGCVFNIVSEMLDLNNSELASVTEADDFIVSDKLTSLMLAQISENKDLNAVLDELFSAEGSEIYLKPAPEYVALNRPLDFYTVVEAARRRGEIAIGYRRHAHAREADENYGIVLNPRKSEQVTFAPADRIIVLADS